MKVTKDWKVSAPEKSNKPYWNAVRESKTEQDFSGKTWRPGYFSLWVIDPSHIEENC
jgi:hypothetical protein